MINGQKVWISRVQHSDLMILLARTTPLDQVTRKSEGMSIFLVDLHHAIKHGMTVRPIPNMVNHETNELFFDNLEIPVENLIGEEGKGFVHPGRPERRAHADRRRVHRRRLLVHRQGRGLRQSAPCSAAPSARTRACSSSRARLCQRRGRQPDALRGLPPVRRPRALRRAGQHGCWPPMPPGKQPTPACNSTAASASPTNTMWNASSARRLYQVAPISTNLILSYVAEHILGLPRSF